MTAVILTASVNVYELPKILLTLSVACLLCILLSAFFSASEMSFSSANRMRLEGAAEQGSRRARLAVKILENFDDALSTILIGNNLVNISVSTMSSIIVLFTLGERWTWLSTVIATLLVITFGETIPKMLAKKNANRYAMAFAYPIRTLMIILKPVIFIVTGLIDLITLPLKGERTGSEDSEIAVEELQSIIETAEDEDVLDEDRSELMQNALEFSDISASEAMTARVDTIAIDIDDSLEDILETVYATTYSRLPVYEGGIDNIIGFLYLNHLLKAMVDDDHPDIRSLLIEPLYVYKTLKLPQVLAELRGTKRQIAIVTDEYGGTLGVISMEDVLEQIVGEIWDETDDVEDEVIERGAGEYELDGDLSVSDFLELMDIPETTFDFESETVGGWTLEVFGGFPQAGATFDYEHFTVTVLAMDGLRVERILVRPSKG